MLPSGQVLDTLKPIFNVRIIGKRKWQLVAEVEITTH